MKLPQPSRRGLLRGALLGAAGLLLPRGALAFGDPARLVFAQARHGGRWDPRPGGLGRLAWEIARRTSIETSPISRPIGLADPDLFRYPLVVLSGDGAIPAPGDAEVASLRRYLSYGGLLLFDDASAAPGGAFQLSARALLSRTLPAGQVVKVPRDHVLYKSFYLLDGPSGRAAASPDLEAVELGGRLAVLYSGNDLVGAYAKDSLGSWEMEVTPGGETQREKAIRLGVNIAMYAMCLDYKEDQVHIPFILKRRRI